MAPQKALPLPPWYYHYYTFNGSTVPSAEGYNRSAAADRATAAHDTSFSWYGDVID
jgi:hypothetical protein